MTENINKIANEIVTDVYETLEPKKWWESKTIWGVVIMALYIIGRKVGVDLIDVLTKLGIDFNDLLVSGVGLAVLGLRTAKRPIGGKK